MSKYLPVLWSQPFQGRNNHDFLDIHTDFRCLLRESNNEKYLLKVWTFQELKGILLAEVKHSLEKRELQSEGKTRIDYMHAVGGQKKGQTRCLTLELIMGDPGVRIAVG